MTITKLIAGLSCITLLIFLIFGCDSKNSIKKRDAPQVTFLLAENQGLNYPTTISSLKFADLVYQRTQGRIKIDVYPSAQLGDEKAAIEQIQIGVIDFLRVHSSPLAEFNRQFAVLSLPYIFESEDHMWKFLEGEMGYKMLNNLSISKMQGLAYYDNGARNLYFTKAVASLAALKSLNIRVQQNRVTMDMITALGAKPVPIQYGDTLAALRNGAIDGAENNFPSYFTSEHYRYAPYCVLSKHQRAPEVLLISKLTWDKLSREDQAVIRQSASEAAKFQRQIWKVFEKDSEAKLRQAGVKIIEITDFKPWQTAVEPVLDKHRAVLEKELAAVERARN
jgi:tripartite ATP-independent transporter DctP family solute receptor